ncbi:MAG: sugar transferase [Lachnospiraceae bacterium]|nr:sugar transferase [Lachnospiraceae bacterium]
MKKLQEHKRIYNLIMALVIVVLQTLVISFVWVVYYNTELPKAYYFWGHVFISVVYMCILLFASTMYGGLKIGSYRMLELLLSQIIATLLTNILFYAIVCMLAYHFPTPLPLIVGMVIQCFLIGAWIFIATTFYRGLFPPLDVLLIYDGVHKDLFVEKVRTRRHQFEIKETIRVSDDLDYMCSRIDEHEAVMLWDINTVMRNRLHKYCYEKSKETYVMPKIMDIVLRGATTLHFFDSPLMLTKPSPIEYEQMLVKRIFDVVFSFVLIIILSPIMLITALFIKLYDRGPVFYKQVRVTEGDREFEIYKFRSMIVDAEKDGVARLAKKNDDRITPVGRVIRKIRVDEFPQLFNVLKGDMSFVGPRPERPSIIEKYRETMPEFRYRTKVKAGITGYAQVYGKYNTLPYDKLKLDLFYIENFSVWLDLRLIILTVKTIFTLESTEGVSENSTTALPPAGEPEGSRVAGASHEEGDNNE